MTFPSTLGLQENIFFFYFGGDGDGIGAKAREGGTIIPLLTCLVRWIRQHCITIKQHKEIKNIYVVFYYGPMPSIKHETTLITATL